MEWNLPEEKRRAILLSQKERKSQRNDQKKDTSLDQAGHNRLMIKKQTKSQQTPYISQHVSLYLISRTETCINIFIPEIFYNFCFYLEIEHAGKEWFLPASGI